MKTRKSFFYLMALIGLSFFFEARAFMPILAFWNQGLAPVVQIDLTGMGLGPTPSNNTGARTISLGGTNIVSYKVVVLSSGDCTDIGVAGALDAASASSVATPFSFTPTDNASNKICAIGKNVSGVWQKSTAPSSATLVIDTVLPLLTASSFSINSGVSPTSNNYISIALNATDDVTGVAKFCFKSNNSIAPTAADSCWAPVPILGGTVGVSVSLTNAPFLIGFSGGFYTVYVWAQDLAGNISLLTNAGAGTAATDKQTIQYDPPQPPVLTNITATNNNTLTPTPALADINFTAGQAVFIKWNVTSINALPANPVSISYTTDEKNFTSIASSLPNSAGAGCSVDGTTFTGCYVWSAPGAPAGYFKIRITVLDSLGLSTISSSPGVNTSQFQIIAGNTDLGLGGNSRTAIFQVWPDGGADVGDPNSFIVSSRGIVYFKDYYRGILKVDPADGLQKLFIPRTGAYSGDGGPASSATLNNPVKIALDSQDRLLIFDQERILRVETNGNIQTLIGGGALNVDGTLGTDFQIAALDQYDVRGYGTFIPAPNGDLYFTDGDPYTKPVNGFKLHWYKASDQKVYSILFSGNGEDGDPTTDVTQLNFTNVGIRFDPITKLRLNLTARATHDIPGNVVAHHMSFDVNTGASLGAGPHIPFPIGTPWGTEAFYYSPFGDLYTFNPSYSSVHKYDPVGNSWSKILGNGFLGQCADGTAALSCPIQLQDFFVDASNQIYFLDGGSIRAIVGGNVVTLMGQQLSTGAGGNPLAARFPFLDFHDQSQGNKIVINDHNGGYLWEFGRSGNLTKLAGNGLIGDSGEGEIADQNAFAARLWQYGNGVIVNPTTNEIYTVGYDVNYESTILKLNRGTGKWESIMQGPGGAPNYWLADGQTRANAPYIYWSLMGFDGTRLLTTIWNWTGSQHDQNYMKFYDVSSGLQTHFGGGPTLDPSCSFDVDGTIISSSSDHPCYHNFVKSTWDAINNRWLTSERWLNKIKSIPVVAGAGGAISTELTTMNDQITSFAYRLESGKDIYYYCGVYDGRIYKVDAVAGTEVALTWPSPTISCTGRSMTVNTSLNALEFPFSQNGLYGMAQYFIGPP